MNTWTKPLITFAIGLILGVGGMYLTGVKPGSIPLAKDGLPDVAGISGEGLSIIKDNQTVTHADLRLTLKGIVREVSNNSITLINGESVPVIIETTDQTVVFKPPKDANSPPTNLKLQDLKANDVIDVFGQLQGNKVIADSIIRGAQ